MKLTMKMFGLLIILTAFHMSYGQLSADPKRLLNWCLDTMTHKTYPGPQNRLHEQCTPWQDRSCCTHGMSVDVHTGNTYNFSYDHCPQTKKMSEPCKRHFRQDHCFYECEPNIGPWVVKVRMRTRKERFYQVPLCSNDCDDWFEACKDDYTCTDNWMLNFYWAKGWNECPIDSKCRTFKEVYGSAPNFCETVYDGSWKYTDNSKPCMRIWFDGRHGNPNEAVAKLRVEELLRMWSTKGSCNHVTGSWGLVAAVVIATLRW